jgi:type I restriction-modification system DNA methylase subunit
MRNDTMSNNTPPVWMLTEMTLSPSQRGEWLQRFARDNGWHPSDQIEEYPGTESFTNGHLLVEHGLDNTAAITFLQNAYSFGQLDWAVQHRLLAISYNNLVDWHLFPDRNGILRVYNRAKPLNVEYVSLHDQPDAWRAESFEQIVGRRVNPNLPSLDSALIQTISDWKRMLAAELGQLASTQAIAELFNAIFFVRAIEDDRRRSRRNRDQVLIEMYQSAPEPKTIRQTIRWALSKLGVPTVPDRLVDDTLLEAFDALDSETVRLLFGSFYTNRFAPYEYDFSLMSKHALSRIYEHYISVLKETVTAQRTLFAPVPDEVSDRSLGGVYTPQYIARFFARFLKQSHPPKAFRQLHVADPACGSGIFLRTLLEMQCDPMDGIDVRKIADVAFQNIVGVDAESNACKATRLSLSLLYLVLTGSFPAAELEIHNEEAIKFFSDRSDLYGTFDAILANPPFVKWENILPQWQSRVADLLRKYGVAKGDLYLAFLRIGLDLVKPGGYMLYVLPHAFLISDNAKGLRSALAEQCWIRFLVDLSDAVVFDDTSSYPILLVLEKKQTDASPSMEPQAVVVRCVSFAGHALQDALDGRFANNSYYSTHTATQNAFRGESWRVLSPKEQRIQIKVARFPSLGEFAIVGQGVITGADSVFIRKASEIPPGEERAYRPFLSDRRMQRYHLPSYTDQVIFFPFDEDQLMSEGAARHAFPLTWSHIEGYEQRLRAYPRTPAVRRAMMANCRCRKPT